MELKRYSDKAILGIQTSFLDFEPLPKFLKMPSPLFQIFKGRLEKGVIILEL